MGMADVLETTRDAVNVRRVFGEPYERDGVIILPAAKLGGGAGGGESEMGEGHEGGGAGMGMNAKPAGAFVMEQGHVRWRPAIDVNRIILGGQIVAIIALLSLRSIAKWRYKTQAAGVLASSCFKR